MAEPLVSLVVLTCNKAQYTARCLPSIAESSYRPLEVVLVDNGSTDATPQVLDHFTRLAGERGISLVRLGFSTNRGAVVGRNAGLARAAGEYLVFLDNDVQVGCRSWLQRLLGALREDPGIGIIGPKLIFPFGEHDIQCAGCEVAPNGRVNFRGRGQPRQAAEFNRRGAVQALTSACWMMPAAAARKIGPLDEQFSPAQFEDLDYCYRFRQAGWRCEYFPAVEMYHFENVTTGGALPVNYTYLTIKNWRKFVAKWRHVFAQEGGPDSKTMVWKNIAGVDLGEVGELPIAD